MRDAASGTVHLIDDSIKYSARLAKASRFYIMTDELQVEYGLFVVPPTHGAEAATIANKFRVLRLEALKADPDAWLSSYEAEVDVPTDDWLTYLRNPLRTLFVCVAKPHSLDRPASLLEDRWIGMIQLIGPNPLSKWTWPKATPLRSEDEELRYHVTGAFVTKQHRSQRPPILARLIWLYNDWQVRNARNLLHQHRIDRRNITKIFCRQRSVVTPKTVHLRKFYESLGTIHYGYVTPAEEFKANEDKVPMPERTEKNRDFFEDCNMTAFEKVIEVTETTVWPEGVLLSQGPWMGSHEKRYSPKSNTTDQRNGALPLCQIAEVAKL